jgi:hypothetical protein
MLTRELLKIVGQMLDFGRSCREIKIILKREWKEKDIDEAIWWFEYYEITYKKRKRNFGYNDESLMAPSSSG